MNSRTSSPSSTSSVYFLYIIRTSSNTLYTGITTDLERRWKEHSRLKAGSKYLKAVRPQELVAAWLLETDETTDIPVRSLASKLESKVKSLDREQKLQLIQRPSRIKRFDECQVCRCKSIHASRRRAIEKLI
ncbi:MAG TPA: hypothetical protein DEA96_07935 [Leptospiraceae bacterium]|nr:hypothetical protein [Spirochaetaceae bacterium]HBS04877.1 hypothetical protein [Leptospiraceae bacterium]